MPPVIESLRGGLIVSCQAPPSSPLNDSYLISTLALVAEQNGAVAVRIRQSDQIAATRARIHLPIIGLDKIDYPDSPVYITPTMKDAERIVASGADIVALDATLRPRPNGERLDALVRYVRETLGKPVMADVATFDEGLYAAECGADVVATTLCGYTVESAGASLPALNLVERLAARLSVPVICEGGVASPEQAQA
ncbi:MAG: N-acetylmannosamine-6-phosphate 2-epimerase, partial [Acidobacteria bacterium]|nr:N-acetylmannosamine-6-phosphate 2-epimerase [Acidobacteriota bacterium]